LNKRKICVVTTSRADYGLLFNLLKEINVDNDLELKIVATGMHLSPEFGLSYKNILNDGFNIDKQVETTLSSDTKTSISKSVGLGLISFTDALNDLKPDILVVLGDKYELLAPVISALLLKIPIAHIHGGETSQGAIDESIRHSITKIASIHFTSTSAYRKRVIQLGENPKNVFNFGAPGIDNIYNLKLFNKNELQNFLDFNFEDKIVLMTYHPVTLENISTEKQIDNILLSIKKTDYKVIFTQANADENGRIINEKIKLFCNMEPNKYKYVENLGQKAYLSCLKYCNLLIGNSSSGIIEAPEFKLPVINIGDRQKGRIKAKNVIDTGYKVQDIVSAFKKASQNNFRNSLKNMKNPYSSNSKGMTSKKIKETLKKINIDAKFLQKKFFDFE
jgi:UDP-N-acetylglucosamine 2-epimerase (non-hydrolysing)/GDP/UDP-N,N'-diacetylbacillosamine 2-epimerase (hydrolysing)